MAAWRDRLRWRETPMQRVSRCPEHGLEVVQEWTIRGWRWKVGCAGCLEQTDRALVHGFAVEAGENTDPPARAR